MYIWARPKADNPLANAADYVERALQESHVSLAPGFAYGTGGDDYIRISVGVADALITEALERLTSWYEGLR